jgi:hypothetical protein
MSPLVYTINDYRKNMFEKTNLQLNNGPCPLQEIISYTMTVDQCLNEYTQIYPNNNDN